MTAESLRPRHTSDTWFKLLLALSRPSESGTELSVIRNDDGITVYAVRGDALSVFATCPSIQYAYAIIRTALDRNPGYGFYVV